MASLHAFIVFKDQKLASWYPKLRLAMNQKSACCRRSRLCYLLLVYCVIPNDGGLRNTAEGS